MDLGKAKATRGAGISGVENPEENDRGVELVIELEDTTNGED